MQAPPVILLQPLRLSYVTASHLRRTFSTSPIQASPSSNGGSFHRSDFANQGYTGFYEARPPTVGPLADASLYGAPRITPKVLKQHLDQFVIGQERAKKIMSVAVFNHYQRIQELQRREAEEEELLQQQARREYVRHPVEDEFPGQQPTVNMYSAPAAPSVPPSHTSNLGYPSSSLIDYSPLTIEKSNVLLLGPSGVGKTLMAKTLARVLEVPFSMSDCTPFTQAGYIGEDVEVCVQRLLAAANYDVSQAERGIICLDEIDKIATAKVSHGKDVSGEGVQQALLKIIEGTTIQVQAKPERNSGTSGSSGSGSGSGSASLGRGQSSSPGGTPSGGGNVHSPAPSKGEVYNVQTDNILFICTGAFIGLHKTIMDRIARGSIGFGARVSSTSRSPDASDPTLPSGNPADDELFRKHLPFYDSPTSNNPNHLNVGSPSSVHASPDLNSSSSKGLKEDQMDDDLTSAPRHNTLDLLTPPDLQKYGMIPELIGRVPVTCALSPLSLSDLIRVLTEPRNSLLGQYSQLFNLSGIELRFTTPALYEVAKTAKDMGTGARGLRTVMERVLGESMFECPGGAVRYVLVTGSAAKREEGVRWFGRGSQARFHADANEDEEAWERERERRRKKRRKESGLGNANFSSFEEYRENNSLAGSG